MAKAKKTSKPQGPSKKQQVKDYHKAHKTATKKEIAKAVDCSYQTVMNALKSKGRGKKKAAAHANATNGAATQFVKEALGMGLDKAIELLQRVRAAVK